MRYGAAHAATRRRWLPLVRAGEAVCARCGFPIRVIDGVPEAWDLDHDDDREGYLGPSHAFCNRRAGGRRGGRAVGRRRRALAALRQDDAWSRDWLE